MSGTNDDTAFFTAGDLVISVYGDGADDGTFGDNQASPIVLDEITTTGSIVTSLELPQTTTTVDGVTENAISGEYGSSSEGSLELVRGWQVAGHRRLRRQCRCFQSASLSVYGTRALAQSTSVQGGAIHRRLRASSPISAIPAPSIPARRVYNVFNTNNPRSVATVNGTSFYISGQGVKGDTTQGVFLSQDGASTADRDRHRDRYPHRRDL